MWLRPILLFAPYILSFVILALLTWWALPRLRVGLVNTALFAFGGIVGMLAISHFALFAFRHLVEVRRVNLPEQYETGIVVCIILGGAEIGGTFFVWLRERCREARQND